MNSNILFYSKKCKYSNEILNTLKQYPNINEKMNLKLADIENPKLKLPSFIKQVPSLLVITNGNKDLLVGDRVNQWLKLNIERLTPKNPQQGQHQQNQSNTQTGAKPGGIADFDPMEMAGFSDKYSYLEGDTYISRNFCHINEQYKIDTVQDQNLSSSNEKKNKLDNDYERLMAQRKMDMPHAPARQ